MITEYARQDSEAISTVTSEGREKVDGGPGNRTSFFIEQVIYYSQLLRSIARLVYMAIASRFDMEEAVMRFGMLPFFRNDIPGFSIQDMAAPGMLFGEDADDYGCWEWKGPVIREQTAAYGKLFRRKAGFVSMELLPDFFNYRRSEYHIAPGSTEAMILELIREREGMTSTELRKEIFGGKSASGEKSGRHSLEAPLQRLQMGGRLLIADFEYKYSARGERYGWGVALYSTPEIWFERTFELPDKSPEESFGFLVSYLTERLPHASCNDISKLIR